jgi:hypothetical protein
MHGHTHQNSVHEVLAFWCGCGKVRAKLWMFGVGDLPSPRKKVLLGCLISDSCDRFSKQYRAPNPQQTGGDTELDPEVQDREQGAKQHIASF